MIQLSSLISSVNSKTNPNSIETVSLFETKSTIDTQQNNIIRMNKIDKHPEEINIVSSVFIKV